MSTEYAQVIVGGSTQGERPWQMTLNYKITTPASPANGTLAALLSAFITEALTPLRLCLPNKCTVVTLRAQSTVAPGYWPVELGTGGLDGLRGVGEVLPPGLGPLLLIRADAPSEIVRAYTRIYMPSMLESDNEDGALLDEYIDVLKAFIASADDLSNAPMEATLGIYSVKTDTFFPSASVQVADRVARIRRRGRAHQGTFSV